MCDSLERKWVIELLESGKKRNLKKIIVPSLKCIEKMKSK